MSNPSDNKPSAPAPGVRKGPGLLLTSAGALVVGGIVAAANWGVSATNGRLDFTEFKTHSLTDGTRNILGRVDTEVTLRLFVSENEILPPQFVPAVEETMNWLARYKELKPDLIKVEKKVVTPTSDEEEQALNSGVQGNRGIFFGMTITCLDKTAVIDWVPGLLSIAGSEDDRIEYALSRTISEVTRRDRKRVGLMTPLKLAGNQMPFGGNQSPPWAFYQELKEQYDLKSLDMGAKSILTTSQDPKEGVDVLILVHPAGISEESLYAVDQYLLNGGRVVSFLDGYSFMASQSGGQQPGMPPGMSPGAVDTGSSLGKLLTTWGYSFDSNKVVADKGAEAPMWKTPLIMNLGADQLTKSEDVVKHITNMWFVFSGGFAGSPATGLRETRYVTTTNDHALVGNEYATATPGSPEGQQKAEELERKFSPEGKQRILALRLDGNFKTAFPEGKPAPAPEKPEGGAGGGFPGGFPGGGPRGAQGAEGTPAPSAPPAATPPPATPAPATPPATPATPPAATPAPAATPPVAVPAAPPAAPAAAPKPAPVTATTPPISIDPAPGNPAPIATSAPLPITPPPIKEAGDLLPPPSGGTPPVATPGASGSFTASTTTEQLKESKSPGMVYLVADSDMLCDLLTNQVARSETGNVPMALNMVDEAAGDADLMKVRSRGAAIRPFSTLNKIKEEAEKKIRSEVQKLEDERVDLQKKIDGAKTNKERNQVIYGGLVADQKRQIEISQKKYQLVKAAKKEIDEQVNSIKWKNVLIPPIVVALAGLAVFITRRFKTAAH